MRIKRLDSRRVVRTLTQKPMSHKIVVVKHRKTGKVSILTITKASKLIGKSRRAIGTWVASFRSGDLASNTMYVGNYEVNLEVENDSNVERRSCVKTEFKRKQV